MRRDLEREPCVGIVANPASARDIRRLVASASGIQLADRANIVERALAGLGAAGVGQAVMMPDGAGIGALVRRSLTRRRADPDGRWPRLDMIDMPVAGSVDDTLRAVERMVELEVAAIIVLGGDGTHRAVASRCGAVPIAGLSTGTNNVFPEFREPTITGLATGLVATGAVAHDEACRGNKVLRVSVNGRAPALALVDVCVTRERFLGARALWKPASLCEIFVTFAEPDAIGLSAIAGLLKPVGRAEPYGLHVTTAPVDRAAIRVRAPIAPGLLVPIGVTGYRTLRPGEIHRVAAANGALALDGEREIEFTAADEIRVWLECGIVTMIDVARVMAVAAERGILTNPPGTESDRRARWP